MGIVKKMRMKAGYTAQQMADYLNVTLQEYLALEKGNINNVDFLALERLAALFHVEEYDILIGKANPTTYCTSPEQEKELIPFFNMVRNYLKMDKLLNEKN